MNILTYSVFLLGFCFFLSKKSLAQNETNEAMQLCVTWNIGNYQPNATYSKGDRLYGWTLKVCIPVFEEVRELTELNCDASLTRHDHIAKTFRYIEKTWRDEVRIQKPLGWEEFRVWLLKIYRLTEMGRGACEQIENGRLNCWDNHFINDTVYIRSYTRPDSFSGKPYKISKGYCCPNGAETDSLTPQSAIMGGYPYNFTISLMEGDTQRLKLHLYADPQLRSTVSGITYGKYYPSFEEMELVGSVVFQHLLRKVSNRLLPFYRKKPKTNIFLNWYKRNCNEMESNKEEILEY